MPGKGWLPLIAAPVLFAVGSGPACAQTALDRPDPTLNPSVPGQIQAQSTLAAGFSSAQIDNLAGHLQQLRQGFDPCASSGRVNLNAAALMARHDEAGPNAVPGTGPAATPSVGPSNAVPGDTPATAAQRCLNEALFDTRESGLWYAGTLTWGANDPATAEHNYFTSPGVTVGLDHQIADRLIVGAALGRGWNNALIDGAGSSTSVMSTSGSVYLHFKPAYTVAVDALFGYEDVATDNRRWIDSHNTYVHGSRHGNGWYGSLAFSSAIQRAGFRVEPYVRSDFVISDLDAYDEAGPTSYALGYGAASSNLDTVSAGTTALHDIDVSGQTLTPVVALKFLRTLSDSQSSSLYYSDIGAGSAYLLAAAVTPQIVTTRQFALRYRNRHGLQGELGTDYAIANSYALRSYTARIHATF